MGHDQKSEFLVSSKEYFVEMVQIGCEKRKIKTYPAVQQYLVSVLEHYLDARNLFEEEVDEKGQRKHTTLAEMFMVASQSQLSEKFDLLKKLGDKSLYISGFFGDSLQRKIVDVDYYANMGGAAYSALSNVVKEDQLSMVYKVISKQFVDFVDVLNYISQQSFVKSDESILRLYDRYLRTGSELAREKLIEMGVVTVSSDHIKLVRQD